MYRIKQKSDGYMEEKYYLQKKFLWWWSDVTQEQCCVDGLCWQERIWFDTVEDAKKYIEDLYYGTESRDKTIQYLTNTGNDYYSSSQQVM